MPAVGEHLTAKNYIDKVTFNSVHESSLLRLGPHEKLKPDEQDSLLLNSTLTSPETVIELPCKSYVDSLHESSRSRRDSSSVINDQNNEFDSTKLTNLDVITGNRNPNLDNEPSKKICWWFNTRRYNSKI